MLSQWSCKVWLAVSLLVALSACLPSRSAVPTPTPLPPPVSYEKPLYTVERGLIVSQFKLTGQVLPSKQDRMLFRASGFVSRVLVQVGDEVEAGQLLAELQIDDLLKELEQAYIDFQVAQADLATIEQDRQYAIARAERQVAIGHLLDGFGLIHAHLDEALQGVADVAVAVHARQAPVPFD